MSDTRQYEFDQSQNELVLDLSDKMRFVSYFLMGLGVLLVAAGIMNIIGGGLKNLSPAGGIIQGVVQFIIGFWTQKAASSFKLIVDTEGNDIGNLMGALGQLRKLYGLQYGLLIIALAFAAIALILSSLK